MLKDNEDIIFRIWKFWCGNFEKNKK